MTRKLGTIEVSDIGLGCMGFSQSYGSVPSEDLAVEAIRSAFYQGCTLFDTAQSYGMKDFGYSHNERLVGKALHPLRNQVVLSTKFFFNQQDLDSGKPVLDIIRSHAQDSLKNLDTDYLDLFFLHRIDERIPVEEVASAMGVLKKEGLIRGWGLSQADLTSIQKAHAAEPLSAVESIYSIAERECEAEILPWCQEHSIGFLAFSPLGSGFLSGTVKKDTVFDKCDVRNRIPQMEAGNREANQPILNALAASAEKIGCTSSQLALAWILKKFENTVPIPGSRKKERITENLQAADIVLPDEDFINLEKILYAHPVYGQRGCVETAQNAFMTRRS